MRALLLGTVAALVLTAAPATASPRSIRADALLVIECVPAPTAGRCTPARLKAAEHRVYAATAKLRRVVITCHEHPADRDGIAWHNGFCKAVIAHGRESYNGRAGIADRAAVIAYPHGT